MYYLTNDILKNLRLLAIHNVQSQTIERYIEKCYRYYSKEYHTPLHIAKEKLTPAEVVLIYMEDECENLQPQELLDIKQTLQKLPQPILNVEDFTNDQEEELSDEEWILQEMAKASKTDKENKAKAKENNTKDSQTMASAMEKAQKAVNDLYKTLEKIKQIDPNKEQIKFDIKE